MTIITDPGRFEVPEPRDLRAMRIIARLTIREAADRAGVDENTLWRWEQGETSPQLRNVQKLIEIYQKNLDGQQQLGGSA